MCPLPLKPPFHPTHIPPLGCHREHPVLCSSVPPAIWLTYGSVYASVLRSHSPSPAFKNLYCICYNIASVSCFHLLVMRYPGLSPAPPPRIKPAPSALEDEVLFSHWTAWEGPYKLFFKRASLTLWMTDGDCPVQYAFDDWVFAKQRIMSLYNEIFIIYLREEPLGKVINLT